MNEFSDPVTGSQTPLKKMELALHKELIGSACKKDLDFREAYELIEKNLTMKVSHKKVLAQFNAAYGHQIHPPRFRKMLDEERMRRSESGESATCEACGQLLGSATPPATHEQEPAR